jgi:acetyltransferase-like isoleucine patch superfamily enzyme
MSGRNIFKKLNSLINILAWTLSLLPRRIRIFFWNLTNSFPGIIGIGLRYCLLKSLAKKCGANVLVGVNVGISGFKNLELGNNVSIHRECYIDAEGGVIIGSDVSVAHQSSILSTNHTWEDENLPIKYNPIKSAPVNIEDDVWIGCGVRILAGITINRRSIVAAGAIVTKNVQSRTIVGGNPARLIKTF